MVLPLTWINILGQVMGRHGLLTKDELTILIL